MKIFCKDGHLTEEALTALISGESLSPLERLEISEHLAYCDICLQQYTDALTDTNLLIPTHSCRETLWRRIQARTFQLFTSRYATAVAAVLLALMVVWGGTQSSFGQVWEKAENAITENTQELPKRWDDALGNLSGNLRGFFNHLTTFRQILEGDHIS